MNKLKKLFTPNPTFNLAPSFASNPPAILSVTKYLKNDLQYIFKPIVEDKPSLALLLF